MNDLTNKQIGMLYEMTELHYMWIRMYHPGATYRDVLELNHIKMMNIVDGCQDCTESMLDEIFVSMIKDYKDLLDNDDIDDEYR
jgi:hypothetical protein